MFPKSKVTAVKYIVFFGKFYWAIVHDVFEKFGKIRQQSNRSVVFKKLRILCFEDGNILAILSLSGKMPFSRDRLKVSANGADIRWNENLMTCIGILSWLNLMIVLEKVLFKVSHHIKMFIVFRNWWENIVEFVNKHSSVLIWWSVHVTNNNIFFRGEQ